LCLPILDIEDESEKCKELLYKKTMTLQSVKKVTAKMAVSFRED
jgi:hypothetical protein